jgi:hypothetical protein
MMSLDSVWKKKGRSLERFHVIICIVAMQLQLQFIIHFLPVSSGLHIYTNAFRSILRVAYALPTVQDKCRLQHHGYNDVADDSWRKCRLLHHGSNAVAMTLGTAAILCPGFCTGSWQKMSKRSKEVNIVGPYIPFDFLQTKGETCATFG